MNRVMKMVMVAVLMIAVAVVGCKKKEEPPVPKAPMGQAPMSSPMMNPMQGPVQAPAGMPGAAPHGPAGPKVEKTVVVPDNVKGKWSKVKLVFQDKSVNKTSEIAAGINSDVALPNTNLKVHVGDFLPDFKMGDTTLTSGSNEPNNPAVKVEIFENGKSIFKGWLFAKFPTMHPFEHAKYGLVLKEGVKS